MRAVHELSVARPYDQLQEQNAILRELPAESYHRIRPYLVPIEIDKGTMLCDADGPISDIYFPHSCVLSLLVPLQRRALVEVATIGNEGLAGATTALGADRSSTRVVVQIPGAALRMPVGMFRCIVDDDNSLRAMTLRFAQSLLDQTVQSVACNRRHSAVQRCARWLLMTHDRAAKPEFPLTHAYIAVMLGVHRSCVATPVGALQRAGCIHSGHGRMTILDRQALEAASCECYHKVEARFSSLFRRGAVRAPALH
jgi:CRP-like cAMP-binding protein